MSVRSWCYRASWLAQGCLPLLRPFALLLASCGGVPSGSLLRVPRQVFAMGSPFRVEPVSILDRNVDSSSTFLVLVGVFVMGSPCRVGFVSELDRNEDTLRTFTCGHVAISRGLRNATGLGLATLVPGVTGLDPRIDAGTALGVTGRVLRAAPGCVVSVRIPQLVGRSGWPVAVARFPPVALVTSRGHVVGDLPPLPACGLSIQDERYGIQRLLPFIYPSLLCDGVTLRVVCVFSHSIVTKSPLGSWSGFLQDGVIPIGSGSADLISIEGIATIGFLGAVFPASPWDVFVSSFGRPVCSVTEWVPHSVVFASGVDFECSLSPTKEWVLALLLLALLPLALPWGLVCFGGLAVILFTWAFFHALVFHAWGAC